MRYIDFTSPAPEYNLAFDEALLDACEEGFHDEILRFWESKAYFAVAGYTNKISTEINVEACNHSGISILRRCTGGGTVLQGLGCLNYTLILEINKDTRFKSIPETNLNILGKHQKAIESISNLPIKIKGTSDLTYENLKFSGNAQRRKKNYMLFHGTFLIDFNIELIEKYLLLPSRQPAYRQNRPHHHFLKNLHIPSQQIKDVLQKTWNATTPLEGLPLDRTERLVQEKYGQKDWIYKF